MKVSEINEGQKATWAIDGPMLTIAVGSQTISTDLAATQKDTAQIVTVFLDEQVQLKIGAGQWYVASVIVPVTRMHMADSGQLDEYGNPQMILEALPLDMEEVSMVLWALPTFVIEEGGTL